MSIQSEIDRIENNIAATYAELEEQGATMPSARNSTNLAATAATTKTVKYIAQTLTAAEKEQARENINAAGRFYGVCSTEAGTVAKTVIVDDSFSLVAGVQITVKFTNANSASSPTLNVNGTGAKPIYRYGTTVVSTGTTTTGWVAGAIQTFTYDGTGWIRDYWSNTTYSNVSLGQGYATCSTAAATVAKTATLSSYALVANGIVAVKFTNDVPAGATLNINSKGAKAIYHKGAAITDGVINAGDTATFIYSTYYHLLSVDRVNDVVSVKDYGAKGNNSTDDTTAFQNALANERVVYVPGGKYKLSGELVLDSNCQLELAQDAVLYFTQTTGNCISMKSSANIVGNHALIQVPYAFSGKVINIDAALNATESEVPPYPQWGPMWKTARYITDLNIVKLNSSGHHYSENGQCSGTAIYIKSYSTTKPDYIWALDLSGLRIAGAFSYGIYTESNNPPDDWLHQMRISGFVDGAEVGVYLKKSDLTYLSVLVLPRVALDGTFYAKWGICLDNSNSVDMSGSRVMDWDEIHSLWREGSINQHLAMLGNCYGAILNEYEYYARPTHDIRSLIYTDYPKNYETLTVIQEPITRWFKPIDHVPYFNNGVTEKKLVLQEELDEIVDTERTANFTNMLPTAIDTDGSVYNGIGYIKSGYRLNTNGSLLQDPYCGCTGFIPVKQNDVVYVKNIKFATSDQSEVGHPCIVSYDSSFAYMAHRTGKNVATDDYFFGEYELLEDGFKIKIFQRSTVAYIRLSYPRANISDQPIVSINNPITYSQVGYLQDGVKVKTANVEGLSEILGSYIDDVDALLGGG